jgi:uncharacterized protein
MLRDQFSDALKTAMKDRNALGTSTVRLIIAKLKEQDIEARGRSKMDGIDEAAIQQMLQGMIKQRRESIALYEQGKRMDLADKERSEIAIIETFLPKQLSDDEAEAAIKEIVAATGAQSVKDMGKVMAGIREKLTGKIDNAKASGIVKKLLGAP